MKSVSAKAARAAATNAARKAAKRTEKLAALRAAKLAAKPSLMQRKAAKRADEARKNAEVAAAAKAAAEKAKKAAEKAAEKAKKAAEKAAKEQALVLPVLIAAAEKAAQNDAADALFASVASEFATHLVRARELDDLVAKSHKAALRTEARKQQRELAKASIARRAEVQAKDRLNTKINRAETAFSSLCKKEIVEMETQLVERLVATSRWINPETPISDEIFMEVAAAQAAATRWFGGMAESVRALMGAKQSTEFLPVLEGKNDLETVRVLFAVIRSAFIHRSMTYSLASHAVLNLRGYELTRTEQENVVEWLRMFRLFDAENDVNRTHLVSITDEKGNTKQEVVKSQPTAVLSQKALQLLQHCLHENVRRFPSPVAYAPLEEVDAVRENESGKLGSSIAHTQHAEIHSVAGERARATADKLAAVPLKLSTHFTAVLSHIWMPAQEAKLAKKAAKEKREVTGSESRLLNKQLARLQKLSQAIGDGAVYISKFFDYRGRIYDGSGELSMQALKDLRGFFGFYNPQPIDWDVIYIQRGRLFQESRGDKTKVTDAVALKMGKAWDGRSPSGNLYGPAAMLFEDPARAICALDANQQGYQLSAAAFGDNGLALLTCLTASPDGKLFDLYGAVAKLTGVSDRNLAKAWMLPYLYGAGAKACLSDFNDAVAPELRTTEAQMREWIKTFEASFPGACALRKHISAKVNRFFDTSDKSDANMAAMAKASAGTFKWTLPDGFVVEYAINEVENLIINKELEGADFKVKLHNTWRKSLPAMVVALAPNIVHSVDAYMLRRVVELCDFEIVAIHDSYGCHSCNVTKMNEAIVQVMKEITGMDLINKILAQIELVPAKEADKDDLFASLSESVVFGHTGRQHLPVDAVNCKYMFI